MTQMTSNNMDEAMNNLASLFPSVDRAFLEDVYVSSKKDFDKTVDQLLSMGIDMEVGAKKDQKPTPTPNVPTYAPIKPQNNNTYPPSMYPNPNSPPIAHHQVSSPQLPAPLTPNVPPPNLPPLNPNYTSTPTYTPTPAPTPVHTITPTPTGLDTSLSYPSRTIPHNMYTTTPPPILSPTPTTTSPAPTAPPAVSASLNSSQVDQKRMETMKQELSLEYQRINEKHTYNLELQQKLEQLSAFTTSEQKKLEQERAHFAEEKKRFTEELSNRFKLLEDESQRQRDEIQRQEEQRVATAREQEEAKAEAKEMRRREKQLKKEEADQQREAAELERTQQMESLNKLLQESEETFESMLKEKNDQIQQMRENFEAETEALKERVKQLERQLKTSEYDTSAEVLSYFSSVVSTLAGGIHEVSLERANAMGENGEMPASVEPLKDLKRTFFRTINDQLSHKLRELE